jgi:hypothetical protein
MERERFVARQVESNRQSRDAWARYGPHRALVTGLVTGLLPANGSLCVLGAGNLNDLDLPEVLVRAGAVELVDLDTEATDAAMRRQGVAGDERLRLKRRDLSGLLGEAPPAGAFDVVLSAGVLTQMLQSVVDAGLDPETTTAVTLQVRDRHLGDLARLTRPGGHAVLVTDTVPTSTASHLRDLEPGQLEPAMAALVAGGNFFTGTNPYRILAVLEEAGAAGVVLHGPWLWPVTPDRDHLTYAITWRPQR